MRSTYLQRQVLPKYWWLAGMRHPYILPKVWPHSAGWRLGQSYDRAKVKACMHRWFILGNSTDLLRTRLDMLTIVLAIKRRIICIFGSQDPEAEVQVYVAVIWLVIVLLLYLWWPEIHFVSNFLKCCCPFMSERGKTQCLEESNW